MQMENVKAISNLEGCFLNVSKVWINCIFTLSKIHTVSLLFLIPVEINRSDFELFKLLQSFKQIRMY